MADLITIDVVAAVIERDGKILVTRRRPGSHLAGLWEFPGGKPDPGETLVDALRREIAEELGVETDVGPAIETIDWAYPDKRVRLHFFHCTVLGDPRPLEGQEMQWLTREELPRCEFPDADAALIARLTR
jgi:8-oxo-dGTP diphosphatase